MADVEHRLSQLEVRVAEVQGDLAVLRTLVSQADRGWGRAPDVPPLLVGD